MARPARPVRIAIADDYEIVVAGINAALTPFSDRVLVVELDSPLRSVDHVDIVLQDVVGRQPIDDVDPRLLPMPGRPKVVVFSWSLQPEVVDRVLGQGAAGYIAKTLTAEEIVSALERVHAGERVRAVGAAPETVGWSGGEHGLTRREAEIITLITQGLTNQEIAERCFLSVNSIKTYIRSAYRKIDVTRRAQAVAWGIERGLDLDPSALAIRSGPASSAE